MVVVVVGGVVVPDADTPVAPSAGGTSPAGALPEGTGSPAVAAPPGAGGACGVSGSGAGLVVGGVAAMAVTYLIGTLIGVHVL